MRINCPLCGERDLREFTYRGSARLMNRPGPRATARDWHEYIHVRDNPAGLNRELWHHSMGCRSWIVAQRSTVTHEFKSTELASDHGGGGA